jgi:hypothetical protein
MMNNIYDVLELCLQELENGVDLEIVLARHPDLASELRPILNAAVMARKRSAAIPAPAPQVVRRGRAKLLQHAAQMREAKAAPRKRMIPLFQRLAISFTLTALFLGSGTGLVSASSSALPGEHLYPIKLTWENVRLFFTFNPEIHDVLENTFEDERLHEVNELIVEGRHESIRFAGVYTEVSGVPYVSGIRIVILNTSVLPAEPLSNGMAVEVTGHTNAQGFVDVESINLLPAGSVVPVGPPVEVEEDSSENQEQESEDTFSIEESEKSSEDEAENEDDQLNGGGSGAGNNSSENNGKGNDDDKGEGGGDNEGSDDDNGGNDDGD